MTKKPLADEKAKEDKLIKEFCAENGIPDFRTDAFNIPFGAFLEAVVLPRALAQRRRKAGDPSARASDFCPACGIGEDLCNLCCARRDDCPHAAGANVEVNLQNRNANWERRQAVFREVFKEYWLSLATAKDEPFKEFLRYRARQQQRCATPKPKVLLPPR